MSTRKPLLGALLLLSAAVIWGFAFVPQKLTVLGLPPLTATALRFALAAPVALIVAAAAGRLSLKTIPLRAALLLGTILFAAYATQTAGLVYAPVARVSLITGLYAVFVPLLAPLFRQPRPAVANWIGAIIAFIGLLALTGVVGEAVSEPLNIGDVLVLLHAVLGACQILVVARVAPKVDPFALNAVQLTVLLCLALPTALIVDGTGVFTQIGAMPTATWWSFAYLAVFSTVVAFTCQLFGQRHASAPTAAVIMLLETPVGVIGAVIAFDEIMSLSQWLGALVLLAGVSLSLWAEVKRSQRDAPA